MAQPLQRPSILIEDNQKELDQLRIDKLGLQQPYLDLNEPVTLRNFQLLGSNFGQRVKKWILALDPGMGKTITAITAHAFESLKPLKRKDLRNRRFLVICPTNAVGTWVRHFRQFLGIHLNSISIISGQPHKRKVAWNRLDAQVFIVTSNSVAIDAKPTKSTTIHIKTSNEIIPRHFQGKTTSWFIDEWHRFLRNRTSNTFKVIKHMTSDVEELCLITGSPATKGPHNLWCALHLCNPTHFSSYWKFVSTYCELEDTPFGKTIVGVKNLPMLKTELLTYIFRRSSEVADMPPINRWMETINLNSFEMNLYNEFTSDAFHILPSGKFIFTQSGVTKAVKLRQLLTTPKLLHKDYPIGSSLEHVLDKVNSEEINHFGIYTYFRDACDIFKKYVEENTDYEAFILYGGMDYTDINNAIESWSKSKKGVIICSIAFAQSFELLKGNNFYFIGPSYNGEENKQAERRGNRLISTDVCNACYIVHNDTYEEDIMSNMIKNAMNVRYMFDVSEINESILNKHKN